MKQVHDMSWDEKQETLAKLFASLNTLELLEAGQMMKLQLEYQAELEDTMGRERFNEVAGQDLGGAHSA